VVKTPLDIISSACKQKRTPYRHNPKTVETEYKDKEAQRKGSNSISAKHMTAKKNGSQQTFFAVMETTTDAL
jgi:hypothetical protein